MLLLTFDSRRPFYDGSRGTYDEDVTLHEVCVTEGQHESVLMFNRLASAMRTLWCSLSISCRR